MIGQGMKHCLAHCTSYMGENVAGKARMVVKGNNCVICLHPNHTADSCFDKKNPKRVCGLDGCRATITQLCTGQRSPR